MSNQVHRFVAKDATKAMLMIQKTLGSDAVILSNKRSAEGVEIHASLMEPEQVSGKVQQSTNAQAVPQTDIDKISEELHSIRRMLDQASHQVPANPQASQPTYIILKQRLSEMGIVNAFADEVLQSINLASPLENAWQQTLMQLSQKVALYEGNILETSGVYAFVGASGVGKTTTIAKLATRFVMEHSAAELGLITTDLNRYTSFEQLFRYGNILGVDVGSATNALELQQKLDNFQNKKLVLIDTAGVSQHDNVKIAELLDLLNSKSASSASIESFLVLPASMKNSVIETCLAAFQSNNLSAAVVTKVDENQYLGSIVSLLTCQNLPIAYLSNGQQIPYDLSQPERDSILQLLLTPHQQQEEFTLQQPVQQEKVAVSHHAHGQVQEVHRHE